MIECNALYAIVRSVVQSHTDTKNQFLEEKERCKGVSMGVSPSLPTCDVGCDPPHMLITIRLVVLRVAFIKAPASLSLMFPRLQSGARCRWDNFKDARRPCGKIDGELDGCRRLGFQRLALARGQNLQRLRLTKWIFYEWPKYRDS